MEQVKKSYGQTVALDGLNLSIQKGQLYGFVGPNGAGKTTAIKMIAGLLLPDSGNLWIDGIDGIKEKEELKARIGYVPDFFGVYDNLKTREYMEFFGSIYGIEGKGAKRYIQELLELVDLTDKLEEYVDHLSRGMKQRLCLARSLIHKPSLLILDEPASGLDPRARYEMKKILRNLIERDMTILISSHILPELAEMCTNIGIIDKGKMILDGTVEHILNQVESANPLVIRFVEKLQQGVEVLKNNPYTDEIAIRGNSVSITFRGDEEEEATLLSTLVERGIGVSSFTREVGNLESLFMQITNHSKEEL